MIAETPGSKNTFADGAMAPYHCERTVLLTALLSYCFPSKYRGLQEYSVTSIVEPLRLLTSLSLLMVACKVGVLGI